VRRGSVSPRAPSALAIYPADAHDGTMIPATAGDLALLRSRGVAKPVCRHDGGATGKTMPVRDSRLLDVVCRRLAKPRVADPA